MRSTTSLRSPQPARIGAALYYNSLRCLGLTAVERRFRDAGLILCYHNVIPAPDGIYGDPALHLPIDRFQEQVSWLASYYAVVPLHEFVERVAAGRSLRSVAAVTFDDAYVGVFEHALPILQELAMPCTVFVVAGAAGRDTGFWWDEPTIVRCATPARRETWLKQLRGDGEAITAQEACNADACLPASYRPADWETIHAWIGRGMEIGVHSASHRSLPTLTDAELRHEIVASRAIVQRVTGTRPEFFAYPYGCWDERSRAAVRSAGYRAAVTLDEGRNGAFADPWSLRRVNVPAGISDAAFEAWAAGFYGRSRA